jgi:TPP-dependent pyruvate/acetoin dehydrogenase alpha subunit
MHLADNSVGIVSESAIVGGGIPLATGVGLSAKVRGTDQVCLCFFGDGAVNQGTFHESLNMASLWNLPVIYLCENNGYAVTTSVEASHGQPSIAARAAAYGMQGLAIDGQDVGAVYEATAEAVARARCGHGPTLIESKTYRFDEHQVGLIVPGDPYRPAQEVERYRTERDPIALYRQTLIGEGVQTSELERIEREVDAAVAEAIGFAEESSYPEVATRYDYLYSNPISAA